MVSLSITNQKAKNRLIFGGLTGTFFLIIWALSARFFAPLSGESNLTIRFYDVGQGDAIMVEKGDIQILIDGGPTDRILTYLGRDLLPWDREIDLLVLTHPHADHFIGLIPVIERYKIGKILYYPSVYDSTGYKKFQELVQREGAEVLWAQAGGEISVGELSLQILWPIANFRSDNANNESVVTLLDYQDFEVLLPGDVQIEVQSQLVIKNDIEVIKVGHHGSVNGSYEPLLRSSQPDLAVISVGARNRYGHPHQQTLDLFAKLKIPLLRTDLNGTVTVRSDGRVFWYDSDR